MDKDWIQQLKFDDEGLLPVVTVDHQRGDVLMLASMNRESLEMTLETGQVHYYSRSRKSLWKKGEESVQYWHSIHDDFESRQPLIQSPST